MKHLFTLFAVLSCMLLSFNKGFAQYPPKALVWGASPFQDSLWSVDPSNSFAVVNRVGPTLAGFTITGINGMAFDPCGFKTYVIMKVSGVSGRVLGTIDLATGVCTQVGNLGDNFSAITFREDGQLFGVTGDGATTPETLYLIDKTNGTKTVAAALGNGADGEMICYNSVDNFIYHWSGNGTVIFEKILSVSPYTVTNIPISGTTNGETFGALHWNADTFLISNIGSAFNFIKTNGTWISQFGSNPDDLRGLVRPPVFALEDNSVCAVHDDVNVGAAGTYGFTVTYHWGDGSQTASGTHAYASQGDYQIDVVLDNGTCTPDTFWTTSVHVDPNPSVTITGPNAICSGANVTLTGTAGGSSQWYFNGVLIPTANTNTYTTNTPGVYNMIKTNVTGCADSAAVGKTLIAATNPTVALGTDVTQCGGTVTLNAGNAGSTYLWSNAATTQSISISATGTANYSVTVTTVNNCTGTDNANVTINPLPVVALGTDITQCAGTVTLNAGNPGAAYLWSNSATTQSITISSTGTATYSVTVTDANTCVGTDAIDVTINPLPVVTLSGATALCPGGSVLLTGSSGGTSQWYRNGVLISLATSNTYSASTPGVYNMIKTNVNTCADSAAVGITVVSVSAPTVALGADITDCGGPVVLDAGNPGEDYLWNDGTTTQTLTVSATGISNYYVFVTDDNGCTGTDTIGVTINALPVVTVTGATALCPGGSVLLTGTSGGSSQWYRNGVLISLATSNTYSASTPGVYNMIKTNVNTCADSAAVGITVVSVSNPTVTLTVNPQTACTGASAVTLSGGTPSGGTYSGPNVSGGDFTPTTAGANTITYTYTDNNGCTNSATDDISVSTCVGLNELSSGSVVVYPNPSNDFVTVKVTDINGAVDMEIFDVSGRRIEQWTEANISADYSHTFSLLKYGAGNYFVSVKTANGAMKYNLIIK